MLKKPTLATGVAAGTPVHDVFPVTIARVRVDGGVIDFADLSLRPQFGTRMHELEGVITGLGTDANRSANVQLDARVDKFGSARIRGQTSVLQPEKLIDIGVPVSGDLNDPQFNYGAVIAKAIGNLLVGTVPGAGRLVRRW